MVWGCALAVVRAVRTGSSRGRACGSRVGLPWLVWLLCLVVERGRCVERGRLSADPCGVGVGTVHVPPSTAQ